MACQSGLNEASAGVSCPAPDRLPARGGVNGVRTFRTFPFEFARQLTVPRLDSFGLVLPPGVVALALGVDRSRCVTIKNPTAIDWRLISSVAPSRLSRHPAARFGSVGSGLGGPTEVGASRSPTDHPPPSVGVALVSQFSSSFPSRSSNTRRSS